MWILIVVNLITGGVYQLGPFQNEAVCNSAKGPIIVASSKEWKNQAYDSKSYYTSCQPLYEMSNK